MPFGISPIQSRYGSVSADLNPGGDWSWLAKQEYQPSRSFASIGYRTRGSLLGGPTYQQFLSEADPKRFTVLAQPPPLTTAVLQGTHNAQGGSKVGQLTLDLIDPFGTLGQATGSFIGRDDPNHEPGGGPLAFLASKNMDLFGQGDTGVPARLADYALALPNLVLRAMQGQSVQDPQSTLPTGLKYRFQADPGYWQLLGAANTDDNLRAVATKVAARYVDPSRNGYLVQQLFEQMKVDRDQVLTAMTSGDQRLDYMAKSRFATDLVKASPAGQAAQAEFDRRYAKGGLRAVQGMTNPANTLAAYGLAGDVTNAIPFIGPAIAAGIAPIDPLVEKEWAKLTPDQRRNYLGNAGVGSMALDLGYQLPLLAGLGGVLATAKASAGIGSKLYIAYDTTLRTATYVMASGVVVAGVNWAAEAAIPGYSDFLGKNIDYARPVSKSSFAGIVNQLGFWSSGTFGVKTATQVAGRAARPVVGGLADGLKGIGVPTPNFGPRELSFFRTYGGSAIRRELTDAGIDGIDTSIKASFLSHLQNWIERTRREPYEAAMRGEPTPYAHVNAMDPQARLEWANDGLARSMESGPETSELMVRMLGWFRHPGLVNPSAEAKAAETKLRDFARTIDEDLSADVGAAYGPAFIASKRIVGRFDAKAMEQWARAKVTELGGDGAKLGKHDADGWAQVVRTLHQVEYHRVNGELAAAIEAEATGEAGKLAVIASDHLFAGQAEALMKRLEAASPEEASAAIADAIASSREAAAWFTKQWHPKPGIAKTPENVPPKVFAAWLEDVLPALPHQRLNAAEGASTALRPINALQQELDRKGTWTLAFKPVDANGNFVSYARTRGGGLLRSPWVEYPLADANIELGNRGFLASKADALTRGFRTRQLVEFQKASLFRMVSAKIDVLPEQIEALNDGILALARDVRLPPQTIGTLGKLGRLGDVPFAKHTRDQIDALVTKIFGEGELAARGGGTAAIDWPSTIAKAYRQSFRLNATAGLTSFLKTMGPLGAAASIASDWAYILWRFGLSPIFKGGEIVESDTFNGLRGVFRTDPETAALFIRGGVGNDGTFLTQELAFDQMVQSLTGRGDLTPSQRLAASLSFRARHVPDDLAMAREKASTAAAAEEGRLADLPDLATDETGLLRQLRATMADEPVPIQRWTPQYTEEGALAAELNDLVGENGIIPGLEVRAKEILDRLDEIERAKGDGGPAFDFESMSYGRQQEWISRLVDSGDLMPNIPPDVEVFYHGTPGPRFERFDNAFMQKRAGLYGPGVYVTADREVANSYRDTQATLADSAIDDALTGISFADRTDYFTPEWLRDFVDHTDEAGYWYQTTHQIFDFKRNGIDDLHRFETRLADVDLVRPGELGDNVALVRVRRGIVSSENDAGVILTHESINPWDIEFADKYGQWMPLARKPTLAEAAGVRGAVLDVAVKKDLNFIDLQNPGDVGRGPLLDALERIQKKYPEVFDPGPAPADALARDPAAPLPPASAWAMSRAIDMVRNNVGSPLVEALDEVRSAFNSFAAQMYAPGPGAEASYARYFNSMWDDLLGDLKAHGFSGWAHEGGNITGGKKHQVLIVWDAADTAVIPHFTPQEVQSAFERFQRRPGAADSMADVAGTPEALFDNVIPDAMAEAIKTGGLKGELRRAAKALQGAGETAWHPTGYKQSRALDLQINLIERQFPALLRAAKMDGVVQLLRSTGIREDRWARWLLKDRQLLDDWLNAKADPVAGKAALDKLIEHAQPVDFLGRPTNADPKAERAAFDALYASSEWDTLSSLWALNLQMTRDEAFGVHFFSPYRSALERSINHPLLGVYPASWSIKAAREWTRFLFDNRMFGELRLGMAPAQAIAGIVHSQQSQFAMTQGDELDHFLQKGPLGNTIFIFNLLLPGDWSSIPFTLSRTIREVQRGNTDPGAILQSNLDYLGATRDARLITQSLGEWHNLIFGKDQQPVAQRLRGVSVRGIADQFEPAGAGH
jgi:hypothetical protein